MSTEPATSPITGSATGDGTPAFPGPIASIVIPAHNEEKVIGRLLSALLGGARPGEFDIIVAANGCTDKTEVIAAGFGEAVRVVSTPAASKRDALRQGSAAAVTAPLFYVDADVVLGAPDIRAMRADLATPPLLAVGPERRFEFAGAGRLVRWYYDVWTRLPEVRAGLFGRGVIGVSAAGQARLAELPAVMADDLIASLAFPEGQRRVTPGATVTIWPPRTFGDLMRRRVRAMTSVDELQRGDADTTPVAQARTGPRDLVRMAARRPLLAPKIALFLGVAVLARLRARRAINRGDYTTWLRDDSSRS